MSRPPVRTLPAGWEREIERILRSVGETIVQPHIHESHATPTQVVTQALKLGFQLAVRERDSIIEQYMKLAEGRQSHTMKYNDGEPLSAAHLASQLDQISMSSPKHNPRIESGGLQMSEMLIEPVDEESNEKCTWEYLSVNLNRVPGYGFGIAVSGGRDNPHFKHGEPSIVVSDVLRAGPAWGQLHINDRVVNANGVSLEDCEYSQAVQIMKDSDQLNMVVKRRVPVPTLEFEQRTLKFTLSKSRKKDDFGVVLGCKFYIRDITNPRLAEKDPGLKEGDTVMRINGMSCEDMSLSEAKKLLDKSREKLALVIQRDVPRGAQCRWSSQQTLYERLGSMSVGGTPMGSPSPSPMPMRNECEGGRMQNGRLSGRYGRMTSSDVVYSPKRQSYSSQPGSRCRTPSYNTYDDYGNLVPVSNRHQQPIYGSTTPVRPMSPATNDEASTPIGEEVSSICHKPPISIGLPDARAVSFLKEGGSVGVRVIGGNEVGIFVSAVQAQSPAAMKGVKPGDKILRVNAKDMKGVTREEAVLYLLGLQDQVELLVQYRKEEYDAIRMQNMGDNFYIRAHFDHDKPEAGEMTFKRGDILQVTDTLFGGSVGAWQAVIVSSPGGGETRHDPVQVKGVIPNASRAEQILAADCSRSTRSNNESKSATFLRKKMGIGRRSKSLTKGHWDEVVFSHGAVNFPAYERVQLKHPGFPRPIVLFGPLADIAREELLKDFPLRFAAPSSEKTVNGNANVNDGGSTSGIVKLSSIREVMDKKKHCVLDVTPSSVYKLQYAQYCPIVLYLNVDSRNRLRDLRNKHCRNSQLGHVSCRKLMEQSARIQKEYGHLLTASLDASKENEWFEALRELIAHLQDRQVWMCDSKPTDLLDDEFLFPMANSRYSTYVGDSDVESLRGDLSHPSTSGDTSYEDALYTSHYDNSPYADFNRYHSTLDRNQIGGHEMYGTKENFVSHFATVRRHPGGNKTTINRPAIKPLPPPRTRSNPYDSQPVVPPKPVAVPPSPLIAPSLSPPLLNDPPKDIDSTNKRLSNASSYNTTNCDSHIKGDVGDRPVCSRQFNEPAGYYDVKQVLAEQVDDYDRRTPSPPRNGPSPYARYTAQSMHRHQHQFNPPAQRPVVYPYQQRPNPNNGFMPPRSPLRPPILPMNINYSEHRPPGNAIPTFRYPPNVPPPAPHSRDPSEAAVNVMSNGVSNDINGTRESHTNGGSHNIVVDSPVGNNFATTSASVFTPKSMSPVKRTANDKGDSGSPTNPMSQNNGGSGLDICERNESGSAFNLYKGHNKDEEKLENGIDDGSEEHTVVAHVSAVMNCEGGSLCSDETGVSIHVPPGALPEHCDQEIYFKVCQVNQVDDPPLDIHKGETLLSPLVMCGPQGLRFLKPVELRLPHNGQSGGSSSFALKSLLKTDSDTEAQWKQVTLAGPEHGTIRDDYVSVHIDHF